MIHRDSKLVVPGDDVVSCGLGQDTVLLNLKSGEYHRLNAVATSIWNYAREPQTVDAIQAHIMEQYDVAEEECRKDLYEVLEDFLAKGLICLGTAGGGDGA